jgi:membrane protease subunit HflK
MSAHNEPVPYEDLGSYRPPNDDRERPPRGDRSDEREQVSLEELIERIKGSLPPLGGKQVGGGIFAILLIVAIIIAVIWLATGTYTVGPDEQAVLRTWGRPVGTAGEGLHWHWPAPVGNTDVESITQTRRIEVGFRGGPDGLALQSIGNESQMITGDENIVDVQMVVQYRINNLQDFLFNVGDPGDPDRDVGRNRPEGRTLRDIAETSLRQVVGERGIDDVLTTGKERVQADTQVLMTGLLKDYGTGLEVLSVLLQNVNPPEEVRDAFEDVVRAREDRERVINLAEAYQADQIPRALGEAAKITEAAQAFKDGRIAKAQGEAEGFKQLLNGYTASKEITRQRLYLEAMEEILPGVTKFILSEDAAGGVLPFLPLTGVDGAAFAPAAGVSQGGGN